MLHHEKKYDLRHLSLFQTYVHGPIQDDEALFLYSICKMIRPKTIVEFGILDGLSTLNFAASKDSDCFLYGFDLNQNSIDKSRERCRSFQNCFFSQIDCVDFTPELIGFRKIDLVFLDCSHDFLKNKICIEKFLPSMNESAIICIHDTGFYHKQILDSMPPSHFVKYPKFKKRFDQKELSPVIEDEQKTVDWMRSEHGEWAQLNLHSLHRFRHGVTILQKSSYLATSIV
jgi:predicted O-methyltransferase YrrM